MAYTVLARKYRSQSFHDVVGQDAIAKTLENALKTGRVSHAYLFSGTRGVGKTTMARILAKSLNCLNSDEPTTTPCCECDSCVAINDGSDIDVIEIDGASNNGVDNIRELRQNAIYRPARSRYKIYIIDEVHMLSSGAFNALLKILEEPPEHVKFIFATTEPNKVLDTIQSRCQRFDFKSIDPNNIGFQLKSVLASENLKYDEDAIVYLSRLANGSMRDSLSLLDQVISSGTEPITVAAISETLGLPDREKTANLLMNIATGKGKEVLEALSQMMTAGMSCLQLVDSMVEMMRDVMVIKTAGADTSLVILTDSEREITAKITENFDISAIIYNITSLEKIRWTIKNSDSPKALLEAMLIRMTLSENFINVPELAKMVQSGAVASVKKNNTPLTPTQGATGNKTTNQNSGHQSSRRSPATDETVNQPEFQTFNCPDLNSLSNCWQSISVSLSQLDRINGGSVSLAKPIEYDGNKLVLEFDKNHLMAMQLLNKPEKIEKIREMFNRIIGCNLKISLVLNENAPSANGFKKPPGAMTSQAEINQLKQDPKVNMILQGLKARVISIDDI